jgi:hypothetical protein
MADRTGSAVEKSWMVAAEFCTACWRPMRQQRARKETPRSSGRQYPRKAIRPAGIGKARQLVSERGYRDHGPGYAIAEFPKGN